MAPDTDLGINSFTKSRRKIGQFETSSAGLVFSDQVSNIVYSDISAKAHGRVLVSPKTSIVSKSGHESLILICAS